MMALFFHAAELAVHVPEESGLAQGGNADTEWGLRILYKDTYVHKMLFVMCLSASSCVSRAINNNSVTFSLLLSLPIFLLVIIWSV